MSKALRLAASSIVTAAVIVVAVFAITGTTGGYTSYGKDVAFICTRPFQACFVIWKDALRE
ncbi:MAG: hypothetical protein AAF360_02740 [Pseudomonadota bacterium]